MFTGIVSAVGTVKGVQIDRSGGMDLEITAPYRGLVLGESVAVDGACLTVVRKGRGWFGVRVVRTTAERTRLGTLGPGSLVNLERALAIGDRLGGHLVQGHVDGVAQVRSRARKGDAVLVDLSVPASVARVSIPLGSITVNGVSLTVNRIPGPGIIQVSLIPHTLRRTTLGNLAPGDRVHVEGDLIGKYVGRLAAPRTRTGGRTAARRRS
jgi:riboflavin synthase